MQKTLPFQYLLSLLLCSLFLLPSLGRAQCDSLWVANPMFGFSEGLVSDMTSDNDDNIYITGQYENTLSLGNYVLNASGALGNFIVKYNASGTRQWVRTIAVAPGSEVAGRRIAVDGNQNVYVTGYVRGSYGVPGQPNLQSVNGSNDVFLIKYDANGNFIWFKTYGGLWNDNPTDLDVDAQGNVLLTGTYDLTVDFDGNIVSSNGDLDVFLIKMDSNGNQLWMKNFGGTNNDWGNTADFDGSGNVVLSGSISSTSVSIDGTNVLNNNQSLLAYVVKWDAQGNMIWLRTFNGATIGAGSATVSLAIDQFDNLYIAGPLYNGPVDFGNGNSLTPLAPQDAFVVKLNPTGNTLWATRYGQNSQGGHGTRTNGIDFLNNGNLLLTGHFKESGSWGNTTLASNGGVDIFFSRVNHLNGNIEWAASYGDTAFDSGIDVAVASGSVWITGNWGANNGSRLDNFFGWGLADRGAESFYLGKLNCPVPCSSAAGTLTGSATHCSSTNSGRLELVGYSGTITGWEVSFDNFATSFPFNYTLDYLNYANVSQPLWFRAKVSNGPNCDTVSNIAVIDPTGTPPQAGQVVGPTTVCQGSAAPVTLSLNGHVGNVVRWESSTDGFATSTPIANTNNFYVVNNLGQTTEYRAVINNGGCDGYSATHTVTPVNCCPQANNVQIGSVTHNSFEVSWTNAASANLFGFSVYYRSVGAPVWQSQFTSGSPVSITGLSNGTAYEVYVESACTQGSATSPIVAVTTLAQPPCTAPTNLNVAMVTLTSVMLDWNAVPTAMFYEISYRRDDQPGNWQSAFSGTNSTSLSGLAPTTWYRVRVRSFCGGQQSPYSAEVFFQTAPQTTGCGVPTNLNATTPNSMTGVINWNAVPGASRYVLQHRVAGASIWTTDTVYGSPFTIGALSPQTTYEYRIQSICGPNSSAFSAPAFFATPMQLCSAPTTVGSVTSTATSATLTWPPSPDAFLYAVQYRPVGSSNWSFTSTVTTSVSLTGLIPGVQYEVRIRTYCQTLGVSSLSNSIFFTTNAGIRAGAVEATSGKSLSVYPNPNNGAFTVAFDAAESGTANLALYDARGAKVWQESRDLNVGANTLRVDAELPGGLYLLELISKGRKQVVKLVIE